MSSSLLDPVVSSFRALSERLKFTVRRQEFNKDSLSLLNDLETGIHRFYGRNYRRDKGEFLRIR